MSVLWNIADMGQDCMLQDEVLYKIAERVKNFAVIYLCDIDQVRFTCSRTRKSEF